MPASTGGHLLHAAEVVDEPRPSTADQEASDEEQRGGREAVVDHVERRPALARRRHREDAQGDEAEVRDGGVGDESLEVGRLGQAFKRRFAAAAQCSQAAQLQLARQAGQTGRTKGLGVRFERMRGAPKTVCVALCPRAAQGLQHAGRLGDEGG